MSQFPTQVVTLGGFKPTLTNPAILTDEHGNILIQCPSRGVYSPSIIFNTYKQFSYLGVKYRVHICVCEAWNPIPTHLVGTKNKLLVNHKDGVKWNNQASNLEWSTFYENNLHAINTGLRGQCITVKIKDLTTGEIHEYPSLNQAARACGMSTENLRYYKNKTNGGVYNGRYSIPDKDGNFPTKARVIRNNNVFAKFVVHMDETKYIVDGYEDLEIITEIDLDTLYELFSANDCVEFDEPHMTIEKHSHYRGPRYDLVKYGVSKRNRYNRTMPDKRKSVMLSSDGGVTWKEYPSARGSVENIVGMGRSAIQKKIKKNGVAIYGNFHVKYKDEV